MTIKERTYNFLKKRKNPLEAKQIAEKLKETPSNVNRALRHLWEEHLVCREKDEKTGILVHWVESESSQPEQQNNEDDGSCEEPLNENPVLEENLLPDDPTALVDIFVKERAELVGELKTGILKLREARQKLSGSGSGSSSSS